jgi:hypothetical protein
MLQMAHIRPLTASVGKRKDDGTAVALALAFRGI